MRSSQLTLVVSILYLSLGFVRAKDAADLDGVAAHMSLCPAQLPNDAPAEAEELASSLPMDLLNPPTLGGSDLLMEGDIVISLQEWTETHGLMDGDLRKASPWGAHRWPVSQSTGLPSALYRMDSTVRNRFIIRSAMNAWESHTCVRFVEAPDTNEPYIAITEGNGCYSYVGQTGKKGQTLSIGRNCYTNAIIKHELGHAIGLFHEQSRSDRNNYVKINYTNVRAGTERNFYKHVTANYGQEYDFYSLMHYTSTSFTKNGGSTVVTLDPAMQIYLGQSVDLTFRDIAIVNHMYGCSDIWRGSCSSPPTCKNGGYLGSNCQCKCPPGTSGSTCAEITGSYYPAPKCGGNITKASTITTPGFPYKFPKGTQCMWWIRAPDDCHMPVVTVNDFNLFGKNRDGLCSWDRLEVRRESLYYGEEYCASDLSPGTTITSSGRDLLLYFRGALSSKRGFSFSVDFQMTCDQCTIEETSSTMRWKSPGYPVRYPAGLQCSINLPMTAPALTVLYYKKIILNRGCSDKFVVNSVNGQTFQVCGRKRRTTKLIGSAHSVSFSSGASPGRVGWYMAFTTFSSSCHRVVDLSSSSSGSLRSPRYPKKHPKNAQCEWWLRAPAGQKVQLTFKYLVLASRIYRPGDAKYENTYFQRYCSRGYVLLSMEGDPAYPPSSEHTLKVCGYRQTGYQVTSVSTDMNLLFYGGRYRSKGMYVTYSLA
ncbi:blastula protease 10-like [Penaeus japonicus]|uniref:blastula protease 10-like n=1 Tax=Penaeus japonicus TaxID=27405 RepID=UPI001C71731C|nr:blastula protease 10-like [Penaeus japonicus]